MTSPLDDQSAGGTGDSFCRYSQTNLKFPACRRHSYHAGNPEESGVGPTVDLMSPCWSHRRSTIDQKSVRYVDEHDDKNIKVLDILLDATRGWTPIPFDLRRTEFKVLIKSGTQCSERFRECQIVLPDVLPPWKS